MDEAVRLLKANGCEQIILLKCTSTYPATPENTNLLTIPHMANMFNCQVGLSDHTMGIGASVAAVALGATIIEKHFTLSRAEGGVDSAFSLEPEELKALVIETERAHKALGSIKYGIQPSEEKSVHFKRSLYAVEDILEGAEITSENVKSKRPAFGLHTRYMDIIVGKQAKVFIKKGTPINFNLIN
jgi:N-acetylneuraminate synthase